MPRTVDLSRTRYALNFHRAKTMFEKDYFTYVLRMYNGNVSRTSDAIGMARRNLQIKIQAYGIDVERMRK